MTKNEKGEIPESPIYQDITRDDQTRARECAEALGVSDEIEGVYSVTKSAPNQNIVFINDLIQCRALVIERQCQILFLSVLSNDLARLTRFDAHTCIVLVDQVFTFAESIPGLKMVVIQAVLPRWGRLSASPDVFWENAEFVNHAVSLRCGLNPMFVQAPMKGLKYKDVNGVKTRVERQDVVSDNIHPYMNLYTRRVKFELLQNIPVVMGGEKKKKKRKPGRSQGRSRYRPY